MSKEFTVVLWEQRRIEMKIEAKDRDHAETTAIAIWDQLPDYPDYLQEIVGVDNHDLKSVIIEEN